MCTNWKRVKIKDVVNVRRGASPRPINNFLSENGISWVKIADATQDNSRFIFSTNEFIKEEGIKNSVVVIPGTLIVSNSATPGLPKIMGITACVHDGWLVFSNYRNILKEFLYYKFIEIRELLLKQANGSVFQNLKTDIIREFEIIIPNLIIQKKIVKILSSLDDKIELNNKINENLHAQAQAIYLEMFNEEINFKEQSCVMSDVFDISIGKTPPRKEQYWFTNNDNDITWLSISDMKSCDVYINSSSEFLTYEAIKKFNVKVVPSNTVILSFKLTVGRVAITNKEMATNEAIAHFVTSNDSIVEYLYFYLKNFNFTKLGSTSSIATAINSKIVKSMPFIMPKQELLNEFHYKVIPYFKMIKRNSEENQKLTQIRDTLLPKLMSGEIEV